MYNLLLLHFSGSMILEVLKNLGTNCLDEKRMKSFLYSLPQR